MTGSDQPRPSVADIIARLEAATGADRELDAEIEALLFGGEIIWGAARFTDDPTVSVRRPSANHLSGFSNNPVRLFTASLDAALALVGEKLDCDRIVGVTEARTEEVEAHSTVITVRSMTGWRSFSASAPTPALAVLLALFCALQSSEPKDQDQ